MDLLKSILWLMEQGLQAAVYFWPVSTVVVLSLPVAIYFDSKNEKKELKKRAFWICLPLAIPITIFVLGGVLMNKTKYDVIPVILFVATVIYSIYTVVKNKKIWKTALSTNLLIVWIGLIAEFISMMSISNDWL